MFYPRNGILRLVGHPGGSDLSGYSPFTGTIFSGITQVKPEHGEPFDTLEDSGVLLDARVENEI